jgi:hypothetical protein
VVLKGSTGTIEAALRATFAITNRLMTAQSRALAAHRAVLECIRVRDADGAGAATIDLLGFAARDLGSVPNPNGSLKPSGRRPEWRRIQRVAIHLAAAPIPQSQSMRRGRNRQVAESEACG